MWGGLKSFAKQICSQKISDFFKKKEKIEAEKFESLVEQLKEPKKHKRKRGKK